MRKNAACRTRCGRRNAKKGKSDMRLFVAVLLSEPMRQALLDTMAQMRAQGARGNFTRKENLHVTLAFLGETDAQGCVRAKRALDACAASCAPIPLQLGQAGRFGARPPAGVQPHPSRNDPLVRMVVGRMGAGDGGSVAGSGGVHGGRSGLRGVESCGPGRLHHGGGAARPLVAAGQVVAGTVPYRRPGRVCFPGLGRRPVLGVGATGTYGPCAGIRRLVAVLKAIFR